MNALKYTLAGILTLLLVLGVIFQLTGKLPQINLNSHRNNQPTGYGAFFRALELQGLKVTQGKGDWPNPETSVLVLLTEEAWKDREEELWDFSSSGGLILALKIPEDFLKSQGLILENQGGGIVDSQGRELGFRALSTFQKGAGTGSKSKDREWISAADLKIGQGAWSLRQETESGAFFLFSDPTPFSNRGLPHASLELLLAPVLTGRKSVHAVMATDAFTWTEGQTNPLAVLFGPELLLPTLLLTTAVGMFFWSSAPRFGSPRGWKPHSRRSPDAHPRAIATLYHKARAWELTDLADRNWVQKTLKLNPEEQELLKGSPVKDRHHWLLRRQKRHELWRHYQNIKKGRI